MNWSINFNQCIKCETNKVKHKGHGLCRRCYSQSNYHKLSIKKYHQTAKGKATERAYTQRIRIKALQAYGGEKPSCACCGESHYEFLAIDHINGGGRKHRQSITSNFHSWLAANKYPLGFQILCHNCNMAKGIYGGCPHKEKELLPVRRIYL